MTNREITARVGAVVAIGLVVLAIGHWLGMNIGLW